MTHPKDIRRRSNFIFWYSSYEEVWKLSIYKKYQKCVSYQHWIFLHCINSFWKFIHICNYVVASYRVFSHSTRRSLVVDLSPTFHITKRDSDSRTCSAHKRKKRVKQSSDSYHSVRSARFAINSKLRDPNTQSSTLLFVFLNNFLGYDFFLPWWSCQQQKKQHIV